MQNNIIFFLEDDAVNRDLVSKILSKEGYTIKTASSLKEAKVILNELMPSLIILDRNLPDGDSSSLCQKLKLNEETKDIPILFLSGKDSVVDKVTGFVIGGDDYLTKPYSIDELVARVQALLRRTYKNIDLSKNTNHISKILTADGIVLDLDKHECKIDDKIVDLWPKEFELLKLFLNKKNKLISRDFLASEIWDFDYCDNSHTIDTTIQRLRKKLGKKSKMLETIKGYGFRFLDQE